LDEWASDFHRTGSTPLPNAGVEDIPALVSLLNDYSVGRFAALVLAARPELIEGALPHVQLAFRQSLEVSITDFDVHRSEMRAALTLRKACLRFFHDAGPHAFDAVEDLLTLLKRNATRGEYGGSGGFITHTLASVCREDPEPLIEMLHHDQPLVKMAVCHTLGHMEESAALVGPALAEMIADEHDGVLREVVSALSLVRWSDARTVEALKERIRRATRYHGYFKKALKVLRAIAAERER
jgi:hypothetical protein